jgi:hypothetical protein
MITRPDISIRIYEAISTIRIYEAQQARWRPGLAPEVGLYGVCPWLTRTAGRPVFRPISPAAMFAQQVRAFELFTRTMQEGVAAATKAMEAFVAARANIRMPGATK